MSHQHGIISGKGTKSSRFLDSLRLTKFHVPQTDDLFVDGFIAATFSPRDAHSYFALLLKTPDFRSHVSFVRGVWYTNFVQQPSSGFPTQLPLDFSLRTTEGTVVPQRQWTPADQVDIRRHIQEATLQFPIFFVKRNGGVGFWLPDILEGGRDDDLYNRDSYGQFGGRSTTHIVINVSSQTVILADGSFIIVRRLPS